MERKITDIILPKYQRYVIMLPVFCCVIRKVALNRFTSN